MMQSTGHTGRHSSQPVQCGSITVCMRLLLPMMASVGQALMHRVQPMHQSSSMQATTVRGASSPNAGFSGMTGLAGDGSQTLRYPRHRLAGIG